MDIVLVGDSAAMTVLGHFSTVPATMDEMIVLARAVTRGARRPLVVADMPFGSFQVSDETAVENAVRFVKEAGADAVKIEGAGPMLSRARALVGSGIPVMGHIGLTPQSATMLAASSPGPLGRTGTATARDALALEEAGCFSLVPRAAAGSRAYHGALRILTIVSAPAECDGQAPSGTTCSGCTRATLRASSSATPTCLCRPRCSRRTPTTQRRLPRGTAHLPIPDEELALEAAVPAPALGEDGSGQ
jgi:3-methyl-2-oxobutanoate hydroxymethyltransferase